MKNPEYKVKFKPLLWPKWSELTVIGHSLQEDRNRMDFFLPDGSIESVGLWKIYQFRLGPDWVAATKERMENEAGGQTINLNVKKK